METILHFSTILIPLFLFQLYISLSLASSDYQSPNKYFVNCGSKSDAVVNSRTFVKDTFSIGVAKTIKDRNRTSQNTNLLYKTAKFSKNPFAYQFEITENGTHFIRLHFFVFESGKTNLGDALFNVSTSTKSLLLSNFSVQKSATNSPSVKEFLLTVHRSDKYFLIYFTPQGKSFAFVNAIEVFSAPNITRDDAKLITHEGKNVTFSGLLSHTLLTVHKINVGGQNLTDSLWRNWIPDDDYLYAKGSVTNCSLSNAELDYGILEEGNEKIAPELVYKTCKMLEDDSFTQNVTWHFNVSRNSRYVLRVHFCDILGSSANTINEFRLHIGSKFTFKVMPYINKPAVPFYHDFVVDSNSSWFLEIGIGTLPDSMEKKAFLNGLEIMELIKERNFPPPKLNKPKNHRLIIVSSVSIASIILILVVVLFGFKYKKAKQVETVSFSHMRKKSSISSLLNCNLKLKMDLDEILYATRGFDAKLLLGEGGFGKVYEGTLRRGLKVAVKRSDPRHGQGLPEFETEIMILSKIRHRHLVSLIGYCDDGVEMILVYEFMEKGTLREHIYDESVTSGGSSSTRPRMTWSQRLEICIGAATGLHYLHTGPNGGIIHRDVKSTNILLDENFTAKVADFGLSKSGPLDPDHFSIGIKGSFGYLDPEYLTTLQFTDKSDVYAFGVVLLEVLCARPAIINSQKIEEVNLAEWGMHWHKKGQLETIVDPSLASEISPNSLQKFGEIVEKCLSRNGDDRPTMIDVLWELEYALQLQKAEVPRGVAEESGTNTYFELSNFGNFPSCNVIEEAEDLGLVRRSS